MNKETKQGVIDRIEDGWAVIYLLNQDEPIHVERGRLPAHCKAGGYLQLIFEGDTIVSMKKDDAATEAARARIQSKLEILRRGDHIRKDKPEGDNPPGEE